MRNATRLFFVVVMMFVVFASVASAQVKPVLTLQEEGTNGLYVAIGHHGCNVGWLSRIMAVNDLNVEDLRHIAPDQPIELDPVECVSIPPEEELLATKQVLVDDRELGFSIAAARQKAAPSPILAKELSQPKHADASQVPPVVAKAMPAPTKAASASSMQKNLLTPSLERKVSEPKKAYAKKSVIAMAVPAPTPAASTTSVQPKNPKPAFVKTVPEKHEAKSVAAVATPAPTKVASTFPMQQKTQKPALEPKPREPKKTVAAVATPLDMGYPEDNLPDISQIAWGHLPDAPAKNSPTAPNSSASQGQGTLKTAPDFGGVTTTPPAPPIVEAKASKADSSCPPPPSIEIDGQPLKEFLEITWPSTTSQLRHTEKMFLRLEFFGGLATLLVVAGLCGLIFLRYRPRLENAIQEGRRLKTACDDLRAEAIVSARRINTYRLEFSGRPGFHSKEIVSLNGVDHIFTPYLEPQFACAHPGCGAIKLSADELKAHAGTHAAMRLVRAS